MSINVQVADSSNLKQDRCLDTTPPPQNTPPLQAQGQTPTAKTGGGKTLDFSSLSQAEKDDPLNVQWLESNDVLAAEVECLDSEMARVAAALAVGGGSEEEQEELEMQEGDLQNRKFMVESMLSVLAHQVLYAFLYFFSVFVLSNIVSLL
jgi:hypothetical protein